MAFDQRQSMAQQNLATCGELGCRSRPRYSMCFEERQGKWSDLQFCEVHLKARVAAVLDEPQTTGSVSTGEAISSSHLPFRPAFLLSWYSSSQRIIGLRQSDTGVFFWYRAISWGCGIIYMLQCDLENGELTPHTVFLDTLQQLDIRLVEGNVDSFDRGTYSGELTFSTSANQTVAVRAKIDGMVSLALQARAPVYITPNMVARSRQFAARLTTWARDSGGEQHGEQRGV